MPPALLFCDSAGLVAYAEQMKVARRIDSELVVVDSCLWLAVTERVEEIAVGMKAGK
jgi:hypothetical protein